MGQEVETSPQRQDRERMGVFTQWVEDLEKTLTNDPEALIKGKKIAQDLRGFLEGQQRALTSLPQEIAGDKLWIEKLQQQPELSNDDKSLLSGIERSVDSLQFNLDCIKQFIEKYESQLQALLSRVDDAISRAEDMIKSKIETGDVKTIMANPDRYFDIQTPGTDFVPRMNYALNEISNYQIAADKIYNPNDWQKKEAMKRLPELASLKREWSVIAKEPGLIKLADKNLQEAIQAYEAGETSEDQKRKIRQFGRLISNYQKVALLLKKEINNLDLPWFTLEPQKTFDLDGEVIPYQYQITD